MTIFVDMLLEGRKEYLSKYAGENGVEDAVRKFWDLRHRVAAPENDIDWWIKKPFKDLKSFVDNFDCRKRSVRRSDAHAEKAKKYGAVLLGAVGGYEVWYVPSYEAAVELGRFYKNMSADWCISTDDPDYFNNQYGDSEFMFLISEDPEKCPDERLAKLALQVPERRAGSNENDYKLWNASDDDISRDAEYVGSDLFDTVGEAMKLWDRIPYSRGQYEREAAKEYARDAAWLRNNVFRGCRDFWKASDGSVCATFGLDDLQKALADGRDYVSPDTVMAILKGEDRLYDWTDGADYDLDWSVTAEFDEKMKPYGLSWDKVADIVQTGKSKDVSEKAERAVAELIDEDFYEGQSYSAVYADCKSNGAANEAYDDVLAQLKHVGVRSVDYGNGRPELKCVFSADNVLDMTKTYRARRDSDMNAFQLMAYDEDDEDGAIGIEEPYYGWSGFDDSLMKEALRYFAKRLAGEIEKVKDSPGQAYFDFDKNYLDNPNNARR